MMSATDYARVRLLLMFRMTNENWPRELRSRFELPIDIANDLFSVCEISDHNAWYYRLSIYRDHNTIVQRKLLCSSIRSASCFILKMCKFFFIFYEITRLFKVLCNQCVMLQCCFSLSLACIQRLILIFFFEFDLGHRSKTSKLRWVPVSIAFAITHLWIKTIQNIFIMQQELLHCYITPSK